MRQLGTDAHQIAGDGLEDGTGGLDGDVLLEFSQFVRQLDDAHMDHWFAAGDIDRPNLT